tara:strand:+ start:16346 stop:16654 length:309 start_codon:yes stop_codon:yes gene_type:complete
MKDLKFRINRTKKQLENLTPPKTMVLKVLQDKINICSELVCLVSCDNNFYQLLQHNVNEFGLKKIIDIDKVEDIRDIDVMNMTNNTKNGTVSNYFSIETINL